MVRGFGVEPRGRVLIDKFPLSSVQLPVVAKLFPNARVLFARRNPRDVVLSCFRRRFGMNASMYQLLTLEGAAAYYDAVMRLSELYRDRLPLPQHLVRYESLVEAFEATARAACDFLGLEWDPGLFDFATRPSTRSITTPAPPRSPAASTARARASGAATGSRWRRCCRCWSRGCESSATSRARSAARDVGGDGLADERLEGLAVHVVALADVDRSAGAAVEAGVEQARRVVERGPAGEGQLDLSL